MFLVDFLKGIGHLFKKTFGIIKKVVPEQYLVQGIELAKRAAEKVLDNPGKRAWVVMELKKLFPQIPDSIANLVVEIAVQHIKSDAIDPAAKKAEDEAKKK